MKRGFTLLEVMLALACWRLRVKECVLCAAVWLTR